MDQGLKERLIGAAVLVVLGVLVIPWILDGRGEQQDTRSSALQLPAPEEPVPVRTETIEIGGSANPVSAAAPAAAQQVAVADLARAPEAPEDSGGSAPALVPQQHIQPEAIASAPPPAPKPTASSDAPPARAAAAPAAAAPKPAATTAVARSSAKGAYEVQLGSFGEEGNARREAQRVGTFGYKATVSSHKSGARTMYRVRVGSYDNRAEASATASSLSAHGFTAQVVAAD
jgi:DedD protein